MGFDGLSGGGMDVDSLRADRNNRMNPPDFAPGQEDDFFDDTLFGGSGGFESNSGFGDSFGGGFGGDSFGGGGFGGAGTFNAPQQPQQPTEVTSVEDKIFDGLAIGAKKAFAFSKAFTVSMKGLTPKFWASWGSNTFVVGCASGALGLILKLFKAGTIGTDFLIGGLLSSAVGVFVLMFKVDKAKAYTSFYIDENTTPIEQGFDDNDSMDFAEDDAFGDEDAFDDEDTFDDDEFGDEDAFGDDDFAEDDWGDQSDFTDGSDDSSFFTQGQEPSEPVSMDEAVETLAEVEKGMFTRQYLFETFTKVMPSYCANFSEVEVVTEDDDDFYRYEGFVREACSIVGVKDEDLPNLLSLERTLLTEKLTFERPPGLSPEKVKNLAEELRSMYAYNGVSVQNSVTVDSQVVGRRCIITIYTGKKINVSLSDMYSDQDCKDFVLNTKNYMPIIIGVTPQGKIIYTDFKQIESMIVTGMPRSGKSWFVKAILAQMCAYVPPSELNIYICDPKDGISDFKPFTLPHVKKFATTQESIINTLRHVVRVLAPERKKIIGDAGFQKIWDYKEKNPNVHMPVIYIVIDEVMSLVSNMGTDKDAKDEFKVLLRELISQLPALGIRIFLIPHVLNNEIVEKKTSDIVACKISVCGNAEHIEKATGSKPKDFPFSLSNTGDMAVRMPIVSSSTMFIHAPTLFDTDGKVNDYFAYMSKVWSKLEPEEVRDSRATDLFEEQNQQELLNMASEALNLDADDADFDVFLDDDTPSDVNGTGSNETNDLPTERSLFTDENEQGLSGIADSAVADTSDDDFFFG